MLKIIKPIIIASLIIFVLTISVNILAQENTNSDTTVATIDEQITAQNLGVSDPKLLPDNPFYFLKEWRRGIQSFFAFGRIKKIELEQKFASERLLELKKMAKEGKADSKILQKATEKYGKTIEKIKNQAQKIEQKASENEDVNKFLDKFTQQQILHEKILQKLESQVPADALEKIKEAREQHLEGFSEVMQKLEDRTEQIKEKIENALQDGDENNPEILEKIKEKMPTEIKEKLIEVKERVIEKTLEKISENAKKCQTDDDCLKSNCGAGTGANCIGLKYVCVDRKCVIKTNAPICNELWWFDNEHRTCQRKKFCGAYMYSGLKTFKTKKECLKSLWATPKTKEECEKLNGIWGQIGLSLEPICRFKTSDGGKICTNSNQCEGSCIENYDKETAMPTSGKCSEFNIVVGCHWWFAEREGSPKPEAICVD